LIAINAPLARPCFVRSEGDWIMFKTNVGSLDSMLRITVGVILIVLVFVGPKTQWGWIGVIPLITGLMRTCPIYSLLGASSCKP
jgi:Protein of unknown function (DUF2892)